MFNHDSQAVWGRELAFYYYYGTFFGIYPESEAREAQNSLPEALAASGIMTRVKKASLLSRHVNEPDPVTVTWSRGPDYS